MEQPNGLDREGLQKLLNLWADTHVDDISGYDLVALIKEEFPQISCTYDVVSDSILVL